jgi:hypothetical protein
MLPPRVETLLSLKSSDKKHFKSPPPPQIKVKHWVGPHSVTAVSSVTGLWQRRAGLQQSASCCVPSQTHWHTQLVQHQLPQLPQRRRTLATFGRIPTVRYFRINKLILLPTNCIISISMSDDIGCTVPSDVCDSCGTDSHAEVPYEVTAYSLYTGSLL